MKKERTPISLEERKKIQLEMLKEIDTFCRNNDIKYSLAFGTLLGAIRHKGFIPWDDDVDIMMPLPEMIRFKKLFRSATMEYCDIDTDKYYEFPFSRIANIRTYNKKGLIAKSYGICIDLYPLIAIPVELKEREIFFHEAEKLINRRLVYKRWKDKVTQFLPINTIPGFYNTVKQYRDFLFDACDYGKTGMYYIVAGPLGLRDKMSYNFDLFNDLIEVDFEDSKFFSIANYDTFLTMRYDDYMQLPPENERHPYHGWNYYWK